MTRASILRSSGGNDLVLLLIALPLGSARRNQNFHPYLFFPLINLIAIRDRFRTRERRAPN